MAHSASAAADHHSARRQERRRKLKKPGMFAAFEWWIAWRYLRSKKKESFVSIISIISLVGIALGVGLVMTVMAVMNGFRSDLLHRIVDVSGHMNVQQIYGPMPDYDAVAARVREVPGVTYTAPVVEGGVMAVKDGQFTYAVVRGMRQSDLRNMELVASNIVAGSLDAFQGSRTIAIGDRAAMNFRLRVGDTLTLITPRGRATAFGTAPREKSYKIGAIFRVGHAEFDSQLIFMPLEQAQLYFSTGDGVTKIDVITENPEMVKGIRHAVLAAAGDDKRAEDWQDMNSAFVGALEVERVVMFFILASIIIVAALNIVSGLVMLTTSKGRDIAVLRTMGAARGVVLRVFLIAGASIGVVGTFTGFFLGLALCYNIDTIRLGLQSMLGVNLFSPEVYFLSKMTAEINNGEVLTVLGLSLALSLLAPLYPAWRAAKMDPVEALRYE